MTTIPLILAQQPSATNTSIGAFMADPFVQGLVLGVALTALFAFVLVTLAGRKAATEATAASVETQPAAVPQQLAAVPAPAAPVRELHRHEPKSLAGIDPHHLVAIAAAATAAVRSRFGDGAAARVRGVARVVDSQQGNGGGGSAWTEAGRFGLQTSHNVRR